MVVLLLKISASQNQSDVREARAIGFALPISFVDYQEKMLEPMAALQRLWDY